MNMYPISLRIRGRRCCVIGGGRVAERKVEGLLKAGGAILVISPELTARLREWHARGEIEVRLRPYRKGDLQGAVLVFAATDDPAVNAAVCAEAEQRGIWVNDAADPQRSTFHVPAVLRRGGLQIAVSTSGAGPLLARKIRDELAEQYDEGYEGFVRLLVQLRQRLKELDLDEHTRNTWYKRWIADRRSLIDWLKERDTGSEPDRALQDLAQELLEEMLAAPLLERAHGASGADAEQQQEEQEVISDEEDRRGL